MTKVLAYLGQAGEPPVTAAWMSQRVYLLEAGAPYARRFRAAGGAHAVAYTDPFRVIPSRHEDLWNTPEDGWLHDATGRRIFYEYPGYGEQNQLNPASPSARAAFRSLVAGIKRNGAFDDIYVDDVSWDLLNVFFHFNAPAVEIDQARYDAAVLHLLRESPLPVLLSGFSNPDEHRDDVSGNMMFLPAAAGGIDNEGCFASKAGKDEQGWKFDANTLLAITAHRKLAICHGQSNLAVDASVPRLFFLASWWLTYDPAYSIALANFANPGNLFVFPEYEIVPTGPLQTARARITELRVVGGAYVRRFRSCYQRGRALGACATAVNPSAQSVVLPSTLGMYTRTLQLDRNNAWNGRAAWTKRSVREVPAGGAAILLR
ncbi:MAG: hypothetical protein ABR591_14990 [Candidatus Velthaea sp.]